jgi:hypothetical protein
VSLCYTRAELQELSDRTRRSAVIRWLQARRIPFVSDADGWPKVLRSAILDQAAPTPHPAAEPQLDFS